MKTSLIVKILWNLGWKLGKIREFFERKAA